MGVRFDAVAAETLVQQMEEYCQAMSQEGAELLDILECTGEWKDIQAQSFSDHVMKISKDLVKELENYSNYMEIYKSRIAELRG